LGGRAECGGIRLRRANDSPRSESCRRLQPAVHVNAMAMPAVLLSTAVCFASSPPPRCRQCAVWVASQVMSVHIRYNRQFPFLSDAHTDVLGADSSLRELAPFFPFALFFGGPGI
jgi:hypothetical protein